MYIYDVISLVIFAIVTFFAAATIMIIICNVTDEISFRIYDRKEAAKEVAAEAAKAAKIAEEAAKKAAEKAAYEKFRDEFPVELIVYSIGYSSDRNWFNCNHYDRYHRNFYDVAYNCRFYKTKKEARKAGFRAMACEDIKFFTIS